MAKSGMRPIVDIYSTFLQRSFDQIFQEVALQNLPVVFCMDRAGLCGPDGPTHHGVFDNSYMRIFPNMVVMAPGDQHDIAPMLDFALSIDAPSSIRYPKTDAEKIDRSVAPMEMGKAEVLSWGDDGNILACGVLLPRAVEAARQLQREGFDVGVINARFVKPLDEAVIEKAVKSGFVITLEENAMMGGFGSAVLECVNQLRLSSERISTLGIPDAFIEHGDRDELLSELGLDVSGICTVARRLCSGVKAEHSPNLA
jgi:1-deoxy-D-xylulose-5-phosphate synthase